MGQMSGVEDSAKLAAMLVGGGGGGVQESEVGVDWSGY